MLGCDQCGGGERTELGEGCVCVRACVHTRVCAVMAMPLWIWQQSGSRWCPAEGPASVGLPLWT